MKISLLTRLTLIAVHCWLAQAKASEPTCTFKTGDGTGGSELYMGIKSSTDECIKTCIYIRKVILDVNGVTVSSNSDNKCYCERNMVARNTVTKWKSCQLPYHCWLNQDPICNFKTGDGTGGTEIYIGKSTATECVKACIYIKKVVPAINGVTVSSNGENKCYCESNMATRNTVTKWKSCFMEPTCTFMTGDGTGGTEIYIGIKTSSAECIKACVYLKEKFTDINGVTMSSNNDNKCYCERSMTGRNTVTKWKNCRI